MQTTASSDAAQTTYDPDAFDRAFDDFVDRYVDRVQIKAVKVASWITDSVMFSAKLYLDGKSAGTVHDSGNGGQMDYSDFQRVRAFNAEIKAAEAAAGRSDRYLDLDCLVGRRLTDYQRRQYALKDRRAGKVSFRFPDMEEGRWMQVKWPDVAKTWPERKAEFMAEAMDKGWFDDRDPHTVEFQLDLLVESTS